MNFKDKHLNRIILFLTAMMIVTFSACGSTEKTGQSDITTTNISDETEIIEIKEEVNVEETKESESANIQKEQEDKEMSERGQTNLLGGLSPQDALEYMKNTKDLVIVEVNTAEWKKATPFTGAMWIPHDEMSERYDEIPKGRPVMLHCGGGIVSVPAYEVLIEMRKDIPELSYIAGAPPIQAYNKWLAEQ